MFRRTHRRPRRRPGFTLIEILLVLAILVILGSFVTYYFIGTQTKAYIDAARSQMQTLKGPIDMYRLEMGAYPASLDDLVTKPNGVKNADKWRQYLNSPTPPDPWGNPYVFSVNGDSYQIKSFGPNGVDGGGDDIIVP